MDQLNEDEVVQKTGGNVKCSMTPHDLECDMNAVYELVEAKFNGQLQNQIEQEELDEAHCT